MKDKLRYAEHLSKSLKAATGKADTYACPLCLRHFPLSRVDELTWDHYPPQSIGGRDRDIALVCEPCRARWNAVDAEIGRLKVAEDFATQYEDASPVVISFPDIEGLTGMRHRAAIRARSGTVEIVGRREANSSEAVEHLEEVLSGLQSEDGSIHMKFLIETDARFAYDPRMVELSLLKAAYLAAFNLLGYPYVLSPALARARRQMLGPASMVFSHCAIKVPPGKLVFPTWIPDDERLILPVYVSEPRPATGLAVFFLRYHLSYWPMVFLPLPARPTFPRYGQIGQALREAENIGIIAFGSSGRLIQDRDVVLVDQRGMTWPIYRRRGRKRHVRRVGKVRS